MTDKKIVIAIDGHSSSGKSTLAKSLARELGYIYIDSGAMYRAVTLYAMRKGWLRDGQPDTEKITSGLKDIKITFRWNEQTGENLTFLNGENVEEEIRRLEVSQHVSHVSIIPEVRYELVKQQRENGKKKGIIMDGRDIGTVVFPDAELKIFITANAEVRSLRRYNELVGKGVTVAIEKITENVLKRDEIDSGRALSPLKIAADAVVLDNSHLTREEQLNWSLKKAMEIIETNED
jgi:CMP/dCMP kinase